MQPIGTASDGAGLGLYSSCGGHEFSFTAGGSLQHVGSKKCVNSKSEVSPAFTVEGEERNSYIQVSPEGGDFGFLSPQTTRLRLDTVKRRMLNCQK